MIQLPLIYCWSFLHTVILLTLYLFL
jgi:hypothetical protein